MEAAELFHTLRALGVVLSIDRDGRLAYDAPANALSDELINAMNAKRDQLLALVRQRPVVVNLRRDAFDMRIDRKTKWGNPFVLGRDGDRDTVINRFREWIVNQPELMAALPELQGKRLGCHCAPLSCHGDVLADLAMVAIGSDRDSSKGRGGGLLCPWCRLGDRLSDDPEGLRCDRCGRLAWRWVGDAIERVDYVALLPITTPIDNATPSAGNGGASREAKATQSRLSWGE